MHLCNNWFCNLKIPGEKKNICGDIRIQLKPNQGDVCQIQAKRPQRLQALDKCYGDSSQCDLITHHLHHHQPAKGVTAEHFISASSLCSSVSLPPCWWIASSSTQNSIMVPVAELWLIVWGLVAGLMDDRACLYPAVRCLCHHIPDLLSQDCHSTAAAELKWWPAQRSAN